ncbi:MAG: hypothetical protein OSB38_15200 [Paraburkholderia fungorum]|nr:hypothetical protein [Paraburkholderia fungorum]
MPTTITVTEDNVLATLRTFLLSIVAAGVEVITGQDNRVPEPVGDDFLVLTPLGQVRLSTNSDTYTDLGTNPGTRNFQRATKSTIQIDVHGPNSADNAAMIETLYRSEYAVDSFASSGLDIQPLYCDDAKQMPFINGENQFEQRWIITAAIQYNPVTAVPQDFADELEVNIVSVDATYPA